MRSIFDGGIDLVKHHEGLHRIVTFKPAVTVAPYICPAGYPTIGYGHVCPKDHPRIGEPEAEAYLRSDLRAAEATVMRACPRALADLTDGQFAALVSLTFNIGSGAFKASTLRRRVNERDDGGVAAEFMRWVWGGGRKLPGLIVRRQDEALMYLER